MAPHLVSFEALSEAGLFASVSPTINLELVRWREVVGCALLVVHEVWRLEPLVVGCVPF